MFNSRFKSRFTPRTVGRTGQAPTLGNGGDPWAPSGTFAFDDLFIDNTGQSLGNTSQGGAWITRSQEGNNYAYPYNIAAPAAAAWVAAVANDSQVMGLSAQLLASHENPMFGMLGFLRELLAREEGIDDKQARVRLGTANNARGSYAIAQFDRATTGTSPYALWYQQCVAAKAWATARGRTLWCPASHLIQGEGDYDRTDAYSYWYGKALTQATNRASDATALGVAPPGGHRYLTYQTLSRPPGLGDYGVARAQYQLAVDYPDLITLTAPNYIFEFTGDPTGIHIMTQEAKWLGAYAGLAVKRQMIDGVPWGVPVATPSVAGSEVTLAYTGIRQGPLVIDTDWLPEQPGYGWRAYDDEGTEVGITDVTIADGTDIVITLDAPPASGWRLRYAQSPTTNRRDNYTGGSGNIRDSHGDDCVYEALNMPMHNWLPAHDVEVP